MTLRRKVEPKYKNATDFHCVGSFQHSDSLLMEFWSLYLGCYQPSSFLSVVIVLLNPLRPNNDLSQTSHCNIKGIRVYQLVRS